MLVGSVCTHQPNAVVANPSDALAARRVSGLEVIVVGAVRGQVATAGSVALRHQDVSVVAVGARVSVERDRPVLAWERRSGASDQAEREADGSSADECGLTGSRLQRASSVNDDPIDEAPPPVA